MKDAPSSESALKRSALRVTPVRLAVLELLRKAASPLDVPQILARLTPGTDAVTVYRTLNTFTRKRLVHRVRGEDRSWRYAIGDTTDHRHEHRHPHFVCDSCGKVECLKEAEIPRTLIKSLRLDDRYAVSYPEVVLHGTCPRCT